MIASSKFKRALAAAVLSMTAATAMSCSPPASEAVAQPGTALGIDPAAMDKSVKPGDDFYAYANGAWMKTAEIPGDRASIGGFVIADQQTEKQLGELMGDITKSDAAGTTDDVRAGSTLEDRFVELVGGRQHNEGPSWLRTS